MSYYDYGWKPYVHVAKRREKAKKEREKLEKKGKKIQPVLIEGKTIATSFWGKGWCKHLEEFSDYDNRLPRGRSYVRNGSVYHLDIQSGKVEALVSGSRLYKINIEIKPLSELKWNEIKGKCKGEIGSVLELLRGKMSKHVMAVVSDEKEGLFPHPHELNMSCSCPDWADLCKHLAATLYGIGNRLDHQPELLFLLRGVNPAELISEGFALPTLATHADALDAGGLADIFGVDIEIEATPAILEKAADAKADQEAPKKKSRRAFNPKAPTGKAIRKLRKLTGLDQASFARVLEVNVYSVKRWENTPGALRIYTKPLAALTRLQEEYLK